MSLNALIVRSYCNIVLPVWLVRKFPSLWRNSRRSDFRSFKSIRNSKLEVLNFDSFIATRMPIIRSLKDYRSLFFSLIVYHRSAILVSAQMKTRYGSCEMLLSAANGISISIFDIYSINWDRRVRSRRDILLTVWPPPTRRFLTQETSIEVLIVEASTKKLLGKVTFVWGGSQTQRAFLVRCGDDHS